MPRIFLSYRRDDSAGYAGRIAEELHREFGAEQVFRDLEDIHPGADFTEEIERNVASCDVLVALIGPHWLTTADAAGNRRLDDPDDFVRMEIASALQRKVRVIPVLVQKADMPASGALPEPLKPLALLQAVELSDTRWNYDMGQLIGALGGKARPNAPWRLRGRLAVVALAAVVALGLGWFFSAPEKAPKKVRVVVQRASDPAPVKARVGNALATNAPDVSGKWLGGWTGPQGRDIRIQFDFLASGDRLLGSVRYPTGEGGIQDGKIDGDRLLFVTRHTPQFEDKEVTISFVGKVSGDQIEFVMQRPTGAQRFVASRLVAAGK